MKDEKLANNVTLAGLRRLREAYVAFLGPEVAVEVGLSLWYYDYTLAVKEKIEVYYYTGGSTTEFKSMKDAYDYLEKLKKEGEEYVDATNSEST